MEIRIDSRQVAPGSLRESLADALMRAQPASGGRAGRVYFEEFRSFRTSIVWEFNRLYWQRLKDWEKATGKGYEQALPGGKSDGNQARGSHRFRRRILETAQGPGEPEPAAAGNFHSGNRRGDGEARRLVARQLLRTRSGARHRTSIRALRFLLGDYSLATLE